MPNDREIKMLNIILNHFTDVMMLLVVKYDGNDIIRIFNVFLYRADRSVRNIIRLLLLFMDNKYDFRFLMKYVYLHTIMDTLASLDNYITECDDYVEFLKDFEPKYPADIYVRAPKTAIKYEQNPIMGRYHMFVTELIIELMRNNFILSFDDRRIETLCGCHAMTKYVHKTRRITMNAVLMCGARLNDIDKCDEHERNEEIKRCKTIRLYRLRLGYARRFGALVLRQLSNNGFIRRRTVAESVIRAIAPVRNIDAIKFTTNRAESKVDYHILLWRQMCTNAECTDVIAV
jgi:hypothetical protein